MGACRPPPRNLAQHHNSEGHGERGPGRPYTGARRTAHAPRVGITHRDTCRQRRAHMCVRAHTQGHGVADSLPHTTRCARPHFPRQMYHTHVCTPSRHALQRLHNTPV